jgi:N-hydroxyarylamine O-acetyltransferase
MCSAPRIVAWSSSQLSAPIFKSEKYNWYQVLYALPHIFLGMISISSLFLLSLYSGNNMKNFEGYLSRIGMTLIHRSPNRETLVTVMDCHSRAIAFENFDVVMGKHISINGSDIEQKMVDGLRGGYCFEQNTLLKMALEKMGFTVAPFLARVRWGKSDDCDGPNTTFTHLVLKTKTQEGNDYLVDVGFAGTNSVEPIDLNVGQDPQYLPEGTFRVVPSKHPGFHVLELFVNNDEWRPLYEWRDDEQSPIVDLECSNWYSCTYPHARFTTQLFASRIIGYERHHILNDQYVIRMGHGINKEVKTETITSKARLLELIDTVFEIKLKDTDGIDRYLHKQS